jgi:hypothetical protein
VGPAAAAATVPVNVMSAASVAALRIAGQYRRSLWR